jgi:DNA-directed RNA polymerase subunit M/transcription elongation factor TFIIS
MSKITNHVTFRENIRTKMLSPLLADFEMPDIINMEKGIFNYTIQEASRRKIVKKWENPHFVQLYKDRLRSIVMNLTNTALIELLRNKEVVPQNVAFMTHQEYNPERWKALIESKMKRDASKYADNIQASTNMYTCKKCKSTRCTYYEMQTRSADEPATIFVTCLDCGKHWRS